MGHTNICLAAASEDVLAGALKSAWKLRMEMNARAGAKRHGSAESQAGKAASNDVCDPDPAVSVTAHAS